MCIDTEWYVDCICIKTIEKVQIELSHAWFRAGNCGSCYKNMVTLFYDEKCDIYVGHKVWNTSSPRKKLNMRQRKWLKLVKAALFFTIWVRLILSQMHLMGKRWDFWHLYHDSRSIGKGFGKLILEVVAHQLKSSLELQL